MAKDLGYDAKAVVMALVWSINLAFATPVGTAPITMTLAGGYRFKDYVIVGGLLVVVCTIATICIYPLVFDL
jgi:di/tricarboxylate transporter